MTHVDGWLPIVDMVNRVGVYARPPGFMRIDNTGVWIVESMGGWQLKTPATALPTFPTLDAALAAFAVMRSAGIC